MDMQDQTLALIIQHGLSVRQIPETVTSLYYYHEGSAVRENQRLVQKNGRTMIETVKHPESGGKWMAKKVPHSDRQVHWDIKTDHLSDTIHEAVNKAVTALEAEQEG